MKYKLQFLIIMVLLCLESYSQKYDVEVFNVQSDKSFILKAANHSNIQQEVVLTLETKNLRVYAKPIFKLVGAKDTIEMVQLTFIKGKVPDFTSKYEFQPKPTETEIAEQDKKLKAIL